MIKRKMAATITETPQGQALSQRLLALEARKASILERTDIGPATRAQYLAEFAVLEADFWMEVDQWIVAEEIDHAQHRAQRAGIWADEAVAKTSYDN